MTDRPESPNQSEGARPPVDAAGAASPPPPPPGYAPIAYAQPPAKASGGILTRVLTSLLTTLLLVSIIVNIYFAIIFSAMAGGISEKVYTEGDTDNRVVILPIDGLIDGTTYNFVREALLELKKNPPKAIVLRVESSGGYVAPSDQIWHALDQFKQETSIPVIASFGSVAASGGYYIASPADAIVAEPTTITGSIGVIAQAFTFQDLLGKVGVTPETIKATRSDKKDMLNPMQAWTDEDRNKLREILDVAHDRFVDVVYQGRKAVLGDDLTENDVWLAATGEVFTAQAAKEKLLVDEIGYLDDAIATAKAEAGIAADVTPHVTVLRRPQPFSILGMLSADVPALSSFSGIDAEQLRAGLIQLSEPRLAYLTFAH